MFFSEAVLRMPQSKATGYFGQEKKGVVDFSLGEPKDAPPESAVNAYIESLKEASNRYAPVQGLPELRGKIAGKFKEENKIDALPGEILITGGASEALAFSVFSLIDKGDEAIIIEPSYPIAASLVRFCGGKPVSLFLTDEKDFQLNIEKLKEKISEKTKMLIINTPHNPTGAVIGKNELRAASEVFGGAILVDEVYENFTYGAEHFSLAALADSPERIITVNSFSKTYAMCGYRIGYLHATKEMISQMLKLKLCISTCTAHPVQRAAIAALDDKNFPKLMKEKFSERKNLMAHGLRKIGLSFVEPKGAFYVFLDVEEFGGDEQAFEQFLKAGVLTMPGRVFHEECRSHVRFSFAADSEMIKEGVKRLESALR